MNYRCAKRIVKLANTIGKDLDIYAEQNPKEDAADGLVRLFIVQQQNEIDKDDIEQTIMDIMCNQTHDAKWSGADADVKTLTLEHMMAARRLGFAQFFGPLSKVDKYQMAFLQGKVSELDFFTKEVLPIADSINGDGRNALEILKAYSPLLSKQNTEKPYELYLRCRDDSQKVANIVNGNHSIRDVVKVVCSSQLLPVPEVLRQASILSTTDVNDEWEEDLQAWVMVMDLPINMVRGYDDYVNQRTRFDTHQGVKGLEFDRVMVIIDDSEAKGFMFSYDKLFGVKELTEIDKKHIEAGEESSVDRTQRLFYVTCTRAKESLAIVMYTSDSEKVKNQAISKGWFSEQEIVLLQ
jgi:DNA helicase-2/ATP-dependent DNA helicase PcrA